MEQEIDIVDQRSYQIYLVSVVRVFCGFGSKGLNLRGADERERERVRVRERERERERGTIGVLVKIFSEASKL